MKYFIFRNANQVTAVSERQMPANIDLNDELAARSASQAIADQRFTAKGDVDIAETTLLDVYDPETDAADELPVPDGTLLQLATELYGNDNLGFDADAEISGLNVQCWRYIDPEDALEHLATGDPMPAERREPDRRTNIEGPYRALRTLTDSLVLELEQQAGVGVPMNTRIQELVTLIKGLAPAPDRQSVVLSVPIQSWEVRERADQDFTDAQRRPWRLEVELQGHQLLVAVWPDGEDRKAAQEGLGLFLEVNRGRPAVHVAPSPTHENVVNLHSVGPGQVEVAPATRLPPATEGTVYPGPALRFELPS